jgi:quercetin dioxygenase-like cupin family protein
MDNIVVAGFPGAQLYHDGFDETVYVLEGELTSGFFDSLTHRNRP